MNHLLLLFPALMSRRFTAVPSLQREQREMNLVAPQALLLLPLGLFLYFQRFTAVTELRRESSR